MINIAAFVADVLEALEKNKSSWAKWFERVGGLYEKRFHGPDWREQEKEFWDQKIKTVPHV